MPYIVPTDIPKGCAECRFANLSFSHPFWAREKPNTKGYVCSLYEQHRVKEMYFDDVSTKAEWCPLREVKSVKE